MREGWGRALKQSIDETLDDDPKQNDATIEGILDEAHDDIYAFSAAVDLEKVQESNLSSPVGKVGSNEIEQVYTTLYETVRETLGVEVGRIDEDFYFMQVRGDPEDVKESYEDKDEPYADWDLISVDEIEF
ncbi:MAG: hypothetical protein H8Z69_03375 [Nanohaloarchaea archaeon]|nr:hypothetical protein [Candidatus Nanohaloarchaea archaeon]